MCFGPEKYASGKWFWARAAKSSAVAFVYCVYPCVYRSGSAIVGTWVLLLKRLQQRIKQDVPKPFSRSIFLRTEAHWPALTSQSEALKLKLPFLLLDNIFYKTLHAHVNIMTTNFLFLAVAVLLFTFPPLKPRTLKHPNQIYANKRNSFMV